MDRKAKVVEAPVGICQRLSSLVKRSPKQAKPNAFSIQREESRSPLEEGSWADMETQVPVTIYRDGRLGVAASRMQIPVKYHEKTTKDSKAKPSGSLKPQGAPTDAPPKKATKKSVTMNVDSEAKEEAAMKMASRPQEAAPATKIKKTMSNINEKIGAFIEKQRKAFTSQDTKKSFATK